MTRQHTLLKPDCTHKQIYDIFLDFINDFSLTQMITQPTRNILDLFLTTNPTLVEQVSCQSGLSDHDVVIAQSLPWITQAIRRQIQKRNHLYKQFKKTGDRYLEISFWHLENQSKAK